MGLLQLLQNPESYQPKTLGGTIGKGLFSFLGQAGEAIGQAPKGVTQSITELPYRTGGVLQKAATGQYSMQKEAARDWVDIGQEGTKLFDKRLPQSERLAAQEKVSEIGGRLGQNFMFAGPVRQVINPKLTGRILSDAAMKIAREKVPNASIAASEITKLNAKNLAPKQLYEEMRGVLTKHGLEGTKAFDDIVSSMSDLTTISRGGGNFRQPESTVQPATFKGFKDLTTKVLDRLKGKSVTSKQEILNFTNMPELKQAERDIIRNVADSYNEAKIPVQEFANKVKSELLPLKRVGSSATPQAEVDAAERLARRTGDWSNYEALVQQQEHGAYNFGGRYESIALPEDLRGNVKNYSENIYQSPIKTSAGDIHFSNAGVENKSNYFGHTRIEDMADNQTRRVIEVQSDLYQKNRLGEINKDFLPENLTPELAARYEKIKPGMVEEGIALNTKIQKLQQYNDPTAHFRMIREEVKKAAQDGKTKLQFPTGETAMKIEGLGQGDNHWAYTDRSGKYVEDFYLNDAILKGDKSVIGKEARRVVAPDNWSSTDGEDWIITDVLGDGKFKAVRKDLYGQYKLQGIEKDVDEIAETFDISGKVDINNPIYRFYEKEVGRYLKNKYNAQLVTDSKGVTWWEVPVNKSYGSSPVEAFGLALPFALGGGLFQYLKPNQSQDNPPR